MTSDTMTEEIWMEDQPLSEKAQAIADIMKNMTVKERTTLLLEVLSHDGDAMQGIRVRMNWEIRNAVMETLNEDSKGRMDSDHAEMIYGQLLYKEIKEVMPILFKEEFEEYTVEPGE